jgi:hypothetical protein
LFLELVQYERKDVGERVTGAFHAGQIVFEAGALNAFLYHPAAVRAVEIFLSLTDIGTVLRFDLFLAPATFPIQATSRNRLHDLDTAETGKL